MQTIELIFPDDLDRNHVLRLLTQSDSGFEPDDRRPLDSAIVDGFTIAGVVLNAFSLAAAIWALKAQLDQAAKSGGKDSKGIRIRRTFSSETRTLPTGEIRSVVKVLEEFTEPAKPK
jgi:hypothetical protein